MLNLYRMILAALAGKVAAYGHVNRSIDYEELTGRI